MEKQVLKRRREGDNFPAPPQTSIGKFGRERDRRQSLGMKFLPLGSTFNALLGGLRLPANDFFQSNAVGCLEGVRQAVRQTGKCDIIDRGGQKHTLLTHSSPLTRRISFPNGRIPGKRERERETEWSSVASKAKRPRPLDPPLSPAKANSPGHAFAVVAAQVGRCPQKNGF